MEPSAASGVRRWSATGPETRPPRRSARPATVVRLRMRSQRKTSFHASTASPKPSSFSHSTGVRSRSGRLPRPLQPRQNLRRMPRRLHLGKYLRDLSPLVDHERSPLHPHHLLPVHILLFPNPVSLRHLLIHVAKQRVRQLLVHLECGLSLGRILGNAKHHYALLLELLEGIAKLARFHGAARSTGFGIEEKHHLLASHSL